MSTTETAGRATSGAGAQKVDMKLETVVIPVSDIEAANDELVGEGVDGSEKRIGEADASWPEWYAAYMVAEQAGTDLPL